jgi:L-2,4-diaminobutyric acid acetyltransferase
VAVAFRKAVLSDARKIWELVRGSKILDLNSPYAYLLLSSHFADTSVVAETASDGALVGFVAAYVPPTKPDTIFVWQVGVRPQCRGRGLAGRMLHELCERVQPQGLQFLEATVTPSNQPSLSLFRAFARNNDAPCSEEILFSRELFPRDTSHDSEILLRIGPLSDVVAVKKENLDASV